MMRGLTVISEELERVEARTPEGMAHWAGSGPDGAKCGKCIHFGYSFIKSNGDASNKNSACEKFFRMTGRHGGTLDKAQLGCKYFEASK